MHDLQIFHHVFFITNNAYTGQSSEMHVGVKRLLRSAVKIAARYPYCVASRLAHLCRIKIGELLLHLDWRVVAASKLASFVLHATKHSNIS